MNEYALTELKVWQEARQFRRKISELVKHFPSDEKFRLADQILRSSRSITANIAEGHGRFHYQENIQFCRVARGSLVETFDHLTCALDEGFITEEVFQGICGEYDHIHRMINGYIAFLNRKKRNH